MVNQKTERFCYVEHDSVTGLLGNNVKILCIRKKLVFLNTASTISLLIFKTQEKVKYEKDI